MFDERNEIFERLTKTKVEEPDEEWLAQLPPGKHLFCEGQVLDLILPDGLIVEAKIIDITRKDLVIRNHANIMPSMVVDTTTTKTGDKGGLISMKLKVRKRTGGKTYLRPIVENTVTIRNKK